MKKSIIVLLSLSFVLSAADTASLWEKAINHEQLQNEFMATRSTVTSIEYGKNGAVKSTEVTILSQSLDKNGEIVRTVISSRKNGKDITEKKQKEMNKRNGRDEFMSIFNPEAEVKYKQTIEHRPINGKATQKWTFKQSYGLLTLKGEAWLELETGRPRRITGSAKSLLASIHELAITYEYDEYEGIVLPSTISMRFRANFGFKAVNNLTTIVVDSYKAKDSD